MTGPRTPLPPLLHLRPARDAAELAGAMALRRRVFVEEQGLFSGTDEDGHDARARHLVAVADGRVAGTVRVYESDEAGVWLGGRLAVAPEFRGGRAGALLVLAAMALARDLGASHFWARVQAGNVEFFLRLGWRVAGEAFEYRGAIHAPMEAW